MNNYEKQMFINVNLYLIKSENEEIHRPGPALGTSMLWIMNSQEESCENQSLKPSGKTHSDRDTGVLYIIYMSDLRKVKVIVEGHDVLK